MTTIAADSKEGVMCSDSFWFNGDECGMQRKVWRIRGELIGTAGDLDEIKRWLGLYRANKPLAGKPSVLRLGAGGLDAWSHLDGWHAVEQKQFAIGSGGKAARGAMAAGVSCRHAVRIACDIDANSGGPVRTYRLK